MEPPTDPDWRLLPHNPTAFFGLGDGFDRRDLKRSYNQLLRKFKPERFPQEFQRIRAAYEQLENAIRYGQPTEYLGPPIESFQWLAQPNTSAASSAAQNHAPAPSSPQVPLHQRIQSGSVSAIYRELKDRPDKSPYDYYALAVMSDVVDRSDGTQFANWVLQGLRAFPGEVGLSRLLHAYFNGPIESEHCPGLLIACSKIIREDLFFPLTEPLWKLLLRTQNFSQFGATLQQCERNLKGINIDNRLAFYLQILKRAVWLADPNWIEESYKLIEDNFDRIPAALDYDLEILSRLRAYIAVRQEFVGEDEIRKRLDRAMRDYFNEDQLIGDQSVLAGQVLIAQDSESLGASFADFGNPTYAAFFGVWVWVSYDVGERHVEPPKETLDQSVWHSRTKTLLTQLERQTVTSRLGMRWATRRVVYRCAQAVCIVFCAVALSLIGVAISTAFLSTSQSEDAFIVLAVLAGVSLGLYCGWRLGNRITTRYWNPFSLRISAECYRKIWQREILNFLARSQLPQQTLRAYVQSFPSTTTSLTWIKYYIDKDYAVPMFAIAHHFVV